jgi:hypothetical protein
LGIQLRRRSDEFKLMQRHSLHVEFIIVVLVELDTGAKITFCIYGIILELIGTSKNINVKITLMDMLNVKSI